MRQPTLIALVASITATGSAYASPHIPRDVIVGSNGVCPAPGTTITVELQPVYYSELFPYNTVVDIFRDGHSYTVANAPITVVSTSTLTKTYTSSNSPNPALTSQSLSASALSARSATSPSAPITVSQAASATSQNQPPITSPANLVIGQDLPRGSVTNLPDDSFILLAFTTVSGAVGTSSSTGRPLVKRQARPSTATPATIVDLSSPTGQPNSVGQDNCDGASPLILRSGSLLQFGNSIAKQPGTTDPLLGFLTDPNDQVNVTFSLVSGYLRWNAPDTGAASFYSCDGLLFAAFGNDVLPGCQEVLVGAIAGRACSQRVEQTRAVEETFTPPVTSPPSATYVTITLEASGTDTIITAPVTATILAPSGDAPGTVVVYTPPPRPSLPPSTYATTTATTRTMLAFTTTISSVLPASLSPAADQYTTLTMAWTGTAPIASPTTSTIVPASGGALGTVVVYTLVATTPNVPTPTTFDPQYTTLTLPSTGTAPIDSPTTSTIVPASPGAPGTVVVYTPAAITSSIPITTTMPDRYTILTLPWTGESPINSPTTSTIALPSGGAPGTIVVYIPAATSAPTTLDDRYTTLTLPWTGTAPIDSPQTSIIAAPSGSESGTVVVFTPAATTASSTTGQFVTTTLPWTATPPIIAPVTQALVEPSNGNPGTIAVFTPAESSETSTTSNFPLTTPESSPASMATFVTVTVLNESISSPVTSEAVSGTITVQYPVTYITRTETYSGTDVLGAATTVTIVSATVDIPGTVVVYSPALVSATTSVDSPSPSPSAVFVSATATSTSTPSTTIFAFTTSPGSSTTFVPKYDTFTVEYTGSGTISAPITVTVVQAADESPGVVEVQTPPAVSTTFNAGYVTVTSAYSGYTPIASPITATIAFPSGSIPGTVVVYTPTATSMSSQTGVTMQITSVITSTRTSSSTSSTKSPVFIPPPPKCGNSGLDFAVQNHSFYNSDAPKYSNVNITYFHTEPPLAVSTTDRVGFQAYGGISYYGKTAKIGNGQYLAVNHHGYLYAPATGVFLFQITGSDDITFAWLGAKAYTNCTRPNLDMEQNFNGLGKNYFFTLEAGTYTPMRILTVNGQGPGIFNFKITAPSGDVVLGPETVNGQYGVSDYIVRRSCDNTSAPAWPPFGAEV